MTPHPSVHSSAAPLPHLLEGAAASAATHRLRFGSLFDPGRGLAFACDPRGEVDFAALSERARWNYDYACAMVGVEYATPAVERV